MMEDLAMQILELLMNSIQAGASRIVLKILDSAAKDLISIELEDNGCGMSEEMVARVTDPFTTSRKTRKVGLGVAFFKGMTELCNGDFEIKSRLGEGTVINAGLQRSHMDTPPMGDLGQMIMYCIQANEACDYSLSYATDEGEFIFESREIREIMEGVSLNEPEVLIWIREYVDENISNLKEGSL